MATPPQQIMTTPSPIGAPTPQYFDPPSGPWAKIAHNALLPAVTENDRVINAIQQFFCVKRRGKIFGKKSIGDDEHLSVSSSSSTITTTTTATSATISQPDALAPIQTPDGYHGHPIFSPIRGPTLVHLIMCISSELGNELFYGTWVVLTNLVWNFQTSVPLLILWALALGTTQFIKDKTQLPRPGLQFFNPKSPRYQKPVPKNEEIYRIETHYAAEFGFPSAHCVGAILGLYNLYLLWKNYTYLGGMGLSQAEDIVLRQFIGNSGDSYGLSGSSNGFIALSTLTHFVIIASCLFWLFLTPLSRLYFGVHSVLDVIGGMAIALVCMLVVILIDSFGWIAWITHSFGGLACLIGVSILFCILYPKHNHVWTNSSGDTALVFGTMTGSLIISTFVNLYSNWNHNFAASLFQTFGSFSISDLFTLPVLRDHQLLLSTQFLPQPDGDKSIQLVTSLQNCAEFLTNNAISSTSQTIMTSASVAVDAATERLNDGNIWATLSTMTSSVVSLKKLAQLCPDIFQHYAEYLPVSQLLSASAASTFNEMCITNNSNSTISIAKIVGSIVEHSPTITDGSTESIFQALSHGQFIKPSSLNPFPYGIVLPAFLYPIPSLPYLSITDILSNVDGILVSVIVGCLLVAVRAVVSLASGYIVRDVVFRKPIFSLCRIILGFSSRPLPYTEGNAPGKGNGEHPNNPEEKTNIDTPSQTKQSTQHSQGGTSTDGIIQRNVIKNADLIQTKFTPEKEASNDELQNCHKWSGPPKSSTLFKWTHDMPIRYINIVDMVDKWVGYIIVTTFTLTFNIIFDDFLGFKYYLYVP